MRIEIKLSIVKFQVIINIDSLLLQLYSTTNTKCR